ncbi:hypothetical protein PG994_011545 [Apiospora phragmitis]|uniref:Uncharacterized protein n=1 Tax=Apiospora phragmitis TaxID=2905665 RepID=A0ABR1TT46_9PEZI
MEPVTLNCKNCEAAIGSTVNAWVQIGKTYFSPVFFPGSDFDVIAVGSIRTGESSTLVDQCDQLMLRLAFIGIYAAGIDGQVQLNVQRTLKLKETAQKNHMPNDHPWSFKGPYQGNYTSDDGMSAGQDSWGALRTDVDAQERDIQMLDIVGRQLVSNCNEAVVRLECDIKSLRTNFDTLRKDLDSHKSELYGVLTDLSFLRDAVKKNQQSPGDIWGVTALREQISIIEVKLLGTQQEFSKRSSSAEENFARGMDSVRGELAQFQEELHDLKRQLGDQRSLSGEHPFAQLRDATARDHAKGRALHYCALSREELDILTNNITKFGNRVGQVETLQMESQLLKSRVQRLEANTTSANRASP